MSVYAVILAGGQGSRLGAVRKAELRVGGQLLIDRVAARLGMMDHPVLISTGSTPQKAVGAGVHVADPDLPIGGPLAGIVAAAHHLADRAGPDSILISVAVDTPFLPTDYRERLLAGMQGDVRAVQAGWGGRAYPTNAAWRLVDLTDIARQIAQGGGHDSPKAVLRTLNAKMIDWSDNHTLDPFANLNTLDDLVALARRAPESAR